MTLPDHTRLGAITSRCAYPGLRIETIAEGSHLFLRVYNPHGTCNHTGNPAPWKGRKWRLSPHMTDGEVVWTAFKAILTALEHEARELFKFDGVAVADSHVDIHKLVALMKSEGALAEREHSAS